MIISILITLAILILAFIAVVRTYMRLPQFGTTPTGVRQARIMQSPNYKNGAFQNQHETPQFTEGANFVKVSREFFFGKSERKQPMQPIAAEKTDLKALDPTKDLIVWFGHSSYFMQLNGKRILVDPVLSGSASPVSFTTKSFKGTDVYSVDDFPEIDYLFITHDHYDHLDYKTVRALRNKVKRVITALGVGAHLEKWGYDSGKITERDWYEEVKMDGGFTAVAMPSRHFSGRGFKRNSTLWTSFVLQTPDKKIYIGGDSGYDSHFKEIGAKYGPFDLVILENGQYNKYWKHIHMMPEETVQAAIDLKAKKLFPVHWSKFALALHQWDEPINRVVQEAERKGIALMHPNIGSATYLNESTGNTKWWQHYQ